MTYKRFFIALCIVAAAAGVASVRTSLIKPRTVAVASALYTSSSSAPSLDVQLAPPTSTQAVAEMPTARVQRSNVTFTVGSSTQQLLVPDGSNVIDAMKQLAANGSITYTGHDYPSLGYFVESINGRARANGYDWILYLNGAYSNTGASQTTLHDGDAVEWRYEKDH